MWSHRQLGRNVLNYFDWLQGKKVIKMALLYLRAALTSDLFSLSLPSAAVLQDSQLHDLQDQALWKLLLMILLANLTSGNLTTPALDYMARTGTVQQRKTCQMKSLERICFSKVWTKPFRSERSAHVTLSPQTTNPSAGWFGIRSRPVRTDILHRVCSPCTSYRSFWQHPSVTIPVTWSVCMG